VSYSTFDERRGEGAGWMVQHVAAEPAAKRERRRMGRKGRGRCGMEEGGGQLRGLGKIVLGLG
jgi:hypothetical protein